MATLIAAAFLLAVSTTGLAAESKQAVTATSTIDTSANVTSSQCASCHLDLGSVNVPGLVFNHGNHMLYSCDTCHDRFPHRPNGGSDKVPMETCFACHGVQHGPQGELATGKCEDCHTKSFTLKPATHTKAWAGKPHADASKHDVNRCMMCHVGSKDCDPCHQKEQVKVGKMPNSYHPVIYPRAKGPAIKIYPTAPTSMSQCVYCHPDIDNIKPGRLIFAHAEHLRRNYPCTTCHPAFGHTAAGPQKPDMLSCYRCHGLDHSQQGMVASGDKCGKCHPKSFQLVPSNHTQAFIDGEHKKKALADPAYCSMCHQSEFCVACHRGEKTSPNAPGQPVIPADHKNAKWRSSHGKLYLAGQGMCGSCHDDPSCKRCHQTVMPHPAGWVANHKPPPGVPTSDCWVCHSQDRNKCQSCHHKQTGQGFLVASACVKCHPEMKKTPGTSIKNKGFAEHAVHFNVAKTKGKPYRCYECHVDYGTSSNAQNLEAQQGHDLRLCYGCHGASDPLGRTIAPYPGAALCRRCHQNINV